MSRLSRTRLPLRCLALASPLLLLGGCANDPEPTGPPGPPEPSYDPVADTVLYRQIEDLPGVRAVDIDFRDTFTDGPVYSGTVRVARDVSPLSTLDRVSAVLWQGAPEPSMLVEVTSPRGSVGNSTVRLQSPSELEERYGPQPGNGEVPASSSPLPRPTTLR